MRKYSAAKTCSAIALSMLMLPACGPPRPSGTRAEPAVAPARAAFGTETRAPSDDLERSVIETTEGVFDPALDCVARKAAEALSSGKAADGAALRHTWPIACGSPLIPLVALRVAATQRDAVSDAIARLPGTGSVALGSAPIPGGDRAIVLTRRAAEIHVERAGASTILRGRSLVPGEAVEAYVGTGASVRVTETALADGAFALDLGPLVDATVEVVVRRDRLREFLVRVTTGNGQRPTDVTRALTRVVTRDPGACKNIPATLDGSELSDVATCVTMPLVGPSKADLASELLYLPYLQHLFGAPDVAVIEWGSTGTMPGVRILHRFETLSATAARARVLAALGARWPSLADRPASDPLAPLLQKWSSAADLNATAGELKPELDRLAGAWSRHGKYYTALVGGRDLDHALAMVRPAVVPLAIDAAVMQVRRPDGTMWHLVAVLLELPA